MRALSWRNCTNKTDGSFEQEIRVAIVEAMNMSIDGTTS